MSDLISRQAAIDRICAKSDEIYETKMKGATFPHGDFFQAMAYAEAIVRNLPSVQPEIIHCIDCRYACIEKDRESDEVYCSEMDFYPSDDFFCGYAKRRE